MNMAKPYLAVSATIDTELLVTLVGSREARSGRQLAEEIGRSPTGVQHVLDRLVSEGLVHRVGAGRAFLYTLNYDHLLAHVVEEMAGARGELVRRLRQWVTDWKTKPHHLSLFGSAARGEGDSKSDVDLFLVRPIEVEAEDELWRKQVEELAEQVYGWTGNNAGIVELGERQLAGLRRRRPPALRELDRDAIDIAGTSVRKLLKK